MFILKVLIEVMVVILIGFGIAYEDKLVEFEDELWAITKFCFKKYVLRSRSR